jgi:uncharacterized caspase-like protein
MFWFIFIASIYLTILVLVSVFRQKAGPPQRRVALLIGNAAYMWEGPLNNPTNDAADMADTLKRLGFDVVEWHDLGVAQMRSVLGDFERKARAADWALVYFAGHGVESNGESWLIPIDAGLTQRAELPGQAVSVQRVLEHLSGVRKLRIVIFDACRNCSLRPRLMMNQGFVRANAHGLPLMKTALGEIVFFAAGHDRMAFDGKPGERNSPFAKALLKYMSEEGLGV